MNQVVIDASFALAWCFDDEATPRTEALLAKAVDTAFVIPPLWKWELSNALLMSQKRGRIPTGKLPAILSRLGKLNFIIDATWESVSPEALVSLGQDHGPTAYDAAYLELALRISVPLATLDRALARAATSLGIQVL